MDIRRFKYTNHRRPTHTSTEKAKNKFLILGHVRISVFIKASHARCVSYFRHNCDGIKAQNGRDHQNSQPTLNKLVSFIHLACTMCIFRNIS